MGKVEDTYKSAQKRMQGAVDALKSDLQGIRTGRANPALVEGLPIDYYGSSVPLMQIAAVTAPEARLLVIEPWDKSAFPAIEKGIMKSSLGLTPSSDGQVIRLAIPALNEQRRKELAKTVDKKVEEAKVAARNVRRDVVDTLRKLEKDKEISQDEDHRGQDQLQKLTDKTVKDIEELGQQKKAEILEG